MANPHHDPILAQTLEIIGRQDPEVAGLIAKEADRQFEVLFHGPAGTQVPIRIRRINQVGDTMTEVLLDGWSSYTGAGGAVSVPSAITATTECGFTVGMDLASISLDKLPEDAFTIDSAGRSIWDDDNQAFNKGD